MSPCYAAVLVCFTHPIMLIARNGRPTSKTWISKNIFRASVALASADGFSPPTKPRSKKVSVRKVLPTLKSNPMERGTRIHLFNF